jgi:hypothetical protein
LRLCIWGKNCLVRALLGTLKSAIFTFTYYKEKAPLLYQQLSEHLQRFAQYMSLPKTNKFASTLSYGIYTFAAHKTETWTANTWGSTNSKPLGPIRMMSQ